MLFCQKLLRMVVSINFCLFPPTPSIVYVHFFTISVKNQARLTRKIIGSFSRVFTVFSHMTRTNTQQPKGQPNKKQQAGIRARHLASMASTLSWAKKNLYNSIQFRLVVPEAKATQKSPFCYGHLPASG